ncbi:MAG: cysteine desulfurase [Anaerolineae bacterium]|jgi:cysteine desulfurase/selenocysteine lyase|nr:cysteine desulfurase [Anaerolineae bacterium]
MFTKTFDVQSIRADFPILHQLHHADVPLTYLDNAASTQKPQAVIHALSDYYSRYNANVHRGIHKLSEEATAAYEGARKKLQKFIHAKSYREILFTSGTTEGINLVAQTWGRANLQAGDLVILTEMEHHSNIVPWQILAAEKGFNLRYLPILPDGTLDLGVYEALLRDHPVKLVSLVHGSNVLGTINPIETIITQAHARGARVLVDAAQTAPHLPLDVQALDVDFLAFSGHKMLGPTGIGVLYGKRALLEAMPPWMGGGDMIAEVRLEGSTWNELPYKFEAGTPHIAGAIVLGHAVDYLHQVGIDAIHAHVEALTQYALEKLRAFPRLTIYGDAPKRGGVAAFSLAGIHAHDLAQLLDQEGIAVRAGHHCTQPLHRKLDLAATTRASFYLYNTFEEVDRLIRALEKISHVFERG